MHRRTVIAAVATSVAVGVAIAVLTQRVSGAFDQIDAAAELNVATATAIVTPTAPLIASGAAAPAPDSPVTATVANAPSPVDAFLVTRADLDRRAATGANLPYGAELSSADIAGLLAADPQFQSALLDLARDADPEVRREATQFLAGVEGGGETFAPE